MTVNRENRERGSEMEKRENRERERERKTKKESGSPTINNVQMFTPMSSVEDRPALGPTRSPALPPPLRSERDPPLKKMNLPSSLS